MKRFVAILLILVLVFALVGAVLFCGKKLIRVK